MESLEAQRDGWMRHAQTSDTEVAWLRKALGITSTEESCAIRDAMERVYGAGKEPASLADLSKLTVAATRGAIWLEEVWREQAQMWERRCNEATRRFSDAGLLAKPPQPVLDALDAWLEAEKPDGVEVTSEQVDANVRWSVVRMWREAAGVESASEPVPVVPPDESDARRLEERAERAEVACSLCKKPAKLTTSGICVACHVAGRRDDL